jgi:hypothetical protein
MKDGIAWFFNGRYLASLPDDMPPNPEWGYWVYGTATGQSQPIVGIPADGIIEIRKGWNLISPVNDILMPDHPDIAPVGWGWDPANQTTVEINVGDTLEAGKAYWVYGESAEPTLFDTGQ